MATHSSTLAWKIPWMEELEMMHAKALLEWSLAQSKEDCVNHYWHNLIF